MVIVLLPSFFFNDTATTEIYTLSLHDALPISGGHHRRLPRDRRPRRDQRLRRQGVDGRQRPARRRRLPHPGAVGDRRDRKSTRLNSSHAKYLVCRLLLEKKNNNTLLNSLPRHL